MNKINIRHWDSSHNDRLRALDFYKGEIEILKDRLTEIAGKNTGKEVALEVEHFQNQFIILLNNIETLEHETQSNIKKIGEASVKQLGFVDEALIKVMENQKDAFLYEEKNIRELRHSFHSFCAEWM